MRRCRESLPPPALALPPSHRLAVNDGGQTSALTAGQLTAVAESLACHVDELSLIDNFKPYIR